MKKGVYARKLMPKTEEGTSPDLPEGPRPFAARFAEVPDHARGITTLKEFGDQVTTYSTSNWADMITTTD